MPTWTGPDGKTYQNDDTKASNYAPGPQAQTPAEAQASALQGKAVADQQQAAKDAANGMQGDDQTKPNYSPSMGAAKQVAKDVGDYAAQQARAAHFDYGGYAGGARDTTEALNTLGAAAEGRSGPVIDTSQTGGDRANTLQDRAGEQSVAEAMRQRALGSTPTIASMQAAEDTRKLLAAQSSAAASARGPAALALAQQGAAANSAAGQSAISTSAQINSANEKRADETAAFGAQSTLQSGDVALKGSDAQQAQAQATFDAQQRALNDKRQADMIAAGIDVQKSQLASKNNEIAGQTSEEIAQGNRDSASNTAEANRHVGVATTLGGTVVADEGKGLRLRDVDGIELELVMG